MKPIVKRVLLGVGVLAGTVIVGGGAWAATQASAFDESVNQARTPPPPSVTISQDPAVIARGAHLTATIAPCATGDCHGSDLGGGHTIRMGPLGVMTGPNISARGLGAVYSDADLARLLRFGVKKDGTSLRFMPVQDFSWLTDADLGAILSFLKTRPGVDRPNGEFHLGPLAKVLDRLGMIPIDTARRVAALPKDTAPAPEPTAAYGRFLGRLCNGCHGEHLAGGPIPGAPPSMAVPLNLTPHPTGLAGYTFEDFKKIIDTGRRKDGRTLDPMMSVEILRAMDDTEQRALWEFLRTVPPRPFGER